ncbi:phosphate ABC transporter substrate-binding/OmpA family protein [Marivita sp. XM-24bin2]|mgnify:CR=1 FL=1|jgi:phosphate transport system substrate-binding protein|uniref:phosphate ABC transporter substrate-binding/OmpA family protein n=1 Tax=unclassified Marivita TaxID=2632480 RepID=UPI000D78E403|nr:phosphate ABC transporter substrate-binding/OmpA family protein [Marivita sp. XM-24bin2]MCR9109583.1 phosphate ABC transporter substrate-binding/OmpA family protein [Paracoccaceae bacterium]PWL36822.1 MAG: cell envelope biogenesis protein OmpA [Marivita sp. XM-24bin2]
MKIYCAALWAALLLLVGAESAWADDVTLRSRDGAIELSGTLLGFDGEFYRVETQYGELTVDGSGVLCEGPGCPSLTDFVAELSISGSSTIGDVLMPALVEGFALQNGLKAIRTRKDDTQFEYVLSAPDRDTPVGRFQFRVSSTDEGFADLLADEADLVMALREIRAGELTLAEEVGLGQLDDVNRSRVLALDAMTVIVSPTNPVSAISVSDLARILSGEIDNWRSLGGPDAPISIHMRDAQSGIAQAVEDRVLRQAGLSLIEDVVRHPTNAALAQAVARDQIGLGVASHSEIGNSKALALTGPCGFQLRANRLTIKTEDYPLTAPMFLYIPARRLPKLGREFLAYTRTAPAQIITRRAGFVDQAPEEITLNAQGDRFANAIRVARGEAGLASLQRMVETLTPLRRLSTSFRFEAGAARLDAQSRSNVQQLAHAIEAGTYDGRHLVFVGFSDGEGPAEGNLRIAKQRAQAVKAAIEAAVETSSLTQVRLSTDAFGEAMPMACDDTSWGRQVNRRVEVWVR